jgi:hypothetical protein
MTRLLTFLLGPIFAREALSVARERRYFWSRVLYCGCFLVVILLIGQ